MNEENFKKNVDNNLENEKVIINNGDEFNKCIDDALDKFNIFENDFEINKMSITNGIVKIKEMWLEVKRENLLDVADFKEFIEKNTNIEVEVFNLTLK